MTADILHADFKSKNRAYTKDPKVEPPIRMATIEAEIAASLWGATSIDTNHYHGMSLCEIAEAWVPDTAPCEYVAPESDPA